MAEIKRIMQNYEIQSMNYGRIMPSKAWMNYGRIAIQSMDGRIMGSMHTTW
jgi:hypothetical protein